MTGKYRHLSLLLGMSLLMLPDRAAAYYPLNCFRTHAKDDFSKSALIVIGRVTAIERFRIPPDPKVAPQEREIIKFFYLATITIGRTLKGKAKTGDEILFFAGCCHQREENNSQPTFLNVANSHPAWSLDYDAVYLLCLNSGGYSPEGQSPEVRRKGVWENAGLEKREIWEPRSCHWSVHRVTTGPDNPQPPLRPKSVPHVELYFDRWNRSSDESIPLDVFQSEQMNGTLLEPKQTNAGSIDDEF